MPQNQYSSAMSQHDKLMQFVTEAMTSVDDIARKWSAAFTKITCEEDNQNIKTLRVHFNELLLQQMLKLDNVEADDNELRNARRRVIYKIEAYLKMLELFSSQNDTYPEEVSTDEENGSEDVVVEQNSESSVECEDESWEIPESINDDEEFEEIQKEEIKSSSVLPETSVPSTATDVADDQQKQESDNLSEENSSDDDDEEEEETTQKVVESQQPEPQIQRTYQEELFRFAQLERQRQQQAREQEIRRRRAAVAAQRERQQELINQRKQKEADRRKYNQFGDCESPFEFFNNSSSRYPSSRNRSHTAYGNPFFSGLF